MKKTNGWEHKPGIMGQKQSKDDTWWTNRQTEQEKAKQNQHNTQN